MWYKTHSNLWWHIYLSGWPNKVLSISNDTRMRAIIRKKTKERTHISEFSDFRGILAKFRARSQKIYEKQQKNAWVWDPYFLIKYTRGITKMPKWKYSMCILAWNLDSSNLYTEKCPSFDIKRWLFITKVIREYLCSIWL